jgi:hypothetical protein
MAGCRLRNGWLRCMMKEPWQGFSCGWTGSASEVLATAAAWAEAFGRQGSTIVLLLCGGDKSSQAKDINLAHDYWNEHGRRP